MRFSARKLDWQITDREKNKISYGVTRTVKRLSKKGVVH